MARGLALAIILIAVALTFWHPFRRVRTALGLNHLLATGHTFLVLGFILGLVFGERQLALADDLAPIVALVAGWVGFAVGMRFDIRVLRTVPGRAMLVALLPGVGAATVVGLASLALLLLLGTSPTRAFAASLVLAAAAGTSGPTLVAMISARRPGRLSHARPVLRMIEFSSGVDDIIVVVLATLAFAVFRVESEAIPAIWLMAAAIGGGALLGAVTWLFLGGRATEDERLLLGLGMLVFIAGGAGWLHLSPAAVAAVAGIVLANLPGDHMAQLLHAVRRVERPAVVIMMTVIGFNLTGGVTWVFFPLLFAMTVLRLAGKSWSAAAVADAVDSADLRTSRRWGEGLTPQGMLGLMVALSFFHVWRDDLALTVLGAVAAASIINEIIAPWLFVRLLKSVTSTGSAVEPERGESA